MSKSANSLPPIKIGSHTLGIGHPPFLVAEMSGNHNQSMDRALKIVDAAKEAGAHAVKLQTYTADSMTLDISEGEFVIQDPKSPWYGRNLYDLYEEAHTPREWHGPLFERCRKLGMVPFSTPFDETAVDFLETLDAPCYKIASFELVDIPLIKKAASTGKPLIMSTGMATEEEIDLAVSTARSTGNLSIILLKCTSSYPAPPDDSNLAAMAALSRRFGVHVGLSDHTLGVAVSIGSVALGAVMIERHFTLSRAEGGVDSQFSLEPREFKDLSESSEKVWRAMGADRIGPTQIETVSKQYRRSVYVAQDIAAGERLTTKNIRCIRPGFGLPPKEYANLLGKKAKISLKRGVPAKLEYFE